MVRKDKTNLCKRQMTPNYSYHTKRRQKKVAAKITELRYKKVAAIRVIKISSLRDLDELECPSRISVS